MLWKDNWRRGFDWASFTLMSLNSSFKNILKYSIKIPFPMITANSLSLPIWWKKCSPTEVYAFSSTHSQPKKSTEKNTSQAASWEFETTLLGTPRQSRIPSRSQAGERWERCSIHSLCRGHKHTRQLWLCECTSLSLFLACPSHTAHMMNHWRSQDPDQELPLLRHHGDFKHVYSSKGKLEVQSWPLWHNTLGLHLLGHPFTLLYHEFLKEKPSYLNLSLAQCLVHVHSICLVNVFPIDFYFYHTARS